MKTKSYKDLIVWQRAIELVLAIYSLTKEFPKEEQYGLISQLRRAAISIASNIAEGYARQYKLEYIQFLSMAFGSCAELETQLIIGQRLSYGVSEQYEKAFSLLEEVSKMLNSMRRTLKANSIR